MTDELEIKAQDVMDISVAEDGDGSSPDSVQSVTRAVGKSPRQSITINTL